MYKKLVHTCLLAGFVVATQGCSTGSGFEDLDRFMEEANAKPRGKIDPLPEFEVYESFTYSAASRRAPFSPPLVIDLSSMSAAPDSNVKPDDDRPKELLESFALTSLKMVGTLKKSEDSDLFALVSDDQGGIHRVRAGQYMGKNHGKVMAIDDSGISLVEIVPSGHGGWLERPRTMAIEEPSG
jgi:type IV pilus assembly protein PilP